MDKPRYRELIVWQKAHRVALDMIRLVRDIPEKPWLNRIVEQLLGCATSIAANIAEGSSSTRGREFIRYLEIALRSATEFDNWIQLVKDSPEINQYLDLTLLGAVESIVIEVLKMLIKMIQSLENKRCEEGFNIRELPGEYFFRCSL